MDQIFPKLVTIERSHPRLRQFCAQLSPRKRALKVTLDHSLLPFGNCYWNVNSKIESSGGEMVLGWQLTYWPKRFIEAMHHAIWRTPEGDLLDVTEKYPHDTIAGYSTFLPQSDVSEINLEEPQHVTSKHFLLQNRKEIVDYVNAYKQKNSIEKELAQLAFDAGYRNEIQFARAELTGDLPLQTYPKIYESEDCIRLITQLKPSMDQLGLCIKKIASLDQVDDLKENGDRPRF
jgi:hypothetical protein